MRGEMLCIVLANLLLTRCPRLLRMTKPACADYPGLGAVSDEGCASRPTLER